VSLLYTRMGVTSGLEFEETAPSNVAAADLGTTLAWRTEVIFEAKRRMRASD
jgi:hypothetical protein